MPDEPEGDEADRAGAAALPPLPYFRCLPDYDVGAWDWARPPRESYVVCTSARSGSTWLCEELAWRGLGDPLEYFNPGFVSYLAARWECRNLSQYRVMLWRNRISPTGTFGLKVLASQFFALLDAVFEPLLDGPPPADPDERRRAYVESVVPEPRYVWLRRADKDRQAVSLWLANATNVWMQFTDEDRRDLGSLAYDFGAIERCRLACEAEDERWAGFFDRNGLAPIERTYEELRADPGAVASLAVALGGQAQATWLVDGQRNHVQTNDATEQLVARFRGDRGVSSRARGPLPAFE